MHKNRLRNLKLLIVVFLIGLVSSGIPISSIIMLVSGFGIFYYAATWFILLMTHE